MFHKCQLLASWGHHHSAVAERGSVAAPVRDASSHALVELWETGHYFPGRPIVRKVARKYDADAYSHSDSACKKFSAMPAKGMPGVMVVFCLRCGKCVGFAFMQNAESPRTVFKLICSRWRECITTTHAVCTFFVCIESQAIS